MSNDAIPKNMTAAQEQGFDAVAIGTLLLLSSVATTEEGAIGAIQALAYLAGCAIAGSASQPELATMLRQCFEDACAQTDLPQHDLSVACLKAAS